MSKEATKKNRSQMIVDEEETDLVAALHNPQPGHNKGNLMHVQDVEEHCIRVAAFTAQHMTKSVLAVIRWAILPEFAGSNRGHTSTYHLMIAQPTANAIRPQSPQGDHIQLYNITGNKADPAPTITVQRMSLQEQHQ